MTDADIDRLVRAADPATNLTPPPPGPLPALTVPDRSRPGRRWLPVAATAAAVVAVVGLVVGLAVPTLPGSGNPSAGPGPSRGANGAVPAGTTGPQEEHTASAGAEHQRAERLLGTLQSAVPAAYTLPPPADGYPDGGSSTAVDRVEPTIGPDGSTMPATDYQAVRDEVSGYTGYTYDAWSIVSDGPRIGTVAARVWVGLLPGDPCAISSKLAPYSGTCRVVTTPAGVRVGVGDVIPDASAPTDDRETQSALYRHPDGTVVLIVQGPGVLNAAVPRLTRPIWTVAQLAALATDPAFTR